MSHPPTRLLRSLLSAGALVLLLVVGLVETAGAQDPTEPGDPAPATEPGDPAPATEAPPEPAPDEAPAGEDPAGEDDGEDPGPDPAEAAEQLPEDETGVKGQLRIDDETFGGIAISVTDESGAAAGEATSDDDGTWFIPLPEPGRYDVALDPATLPDGVELADPDRAELNVRVQGGRTRTVLFGLTRGDAPPPTSPDGDDPDAAAPAPAPARGQPAFTQRAAARLLDGVVFGLILAVAAIGLSLIFGTTKLVNFAHGEMVAAGAIIAWFLSSGSPRLSVVTAGLLAVVIGGLIGGATETGLWRPLRARRAGKFQLLVISIGLSLAARQGLLIWFGAGDRRYRQFNIQRDSWSIGPFNVTARDAAIMAICLVVLVGVALMLQRTRIGKALRAVADNPDLAASSGINVRRVILFVWVLGGALAAGGGVLQGVATRVDYFMGFQLLLLMFAGVILGGLGTAYGAMLGGLVVGITTELSTLVIAPELKTVAALLVLILVLLVRPQGILGSRERVG